MSDDQCCSISTVYLASSAAATAVLSGDQRYKAPIEVPARSATAVTGEQSAWFECMKLTIVPPLALSQVQLDRERVMVGGRHRAVNLRLAEANGPTRKNPINRSSFLEKRVRRRGQVLIREGIPEL